jgi:hypothetical protein
MRVDVTRTHVRPAEVVTAHVRATDEVPAAEAAVHTDVPVAAAEVTASTEVGASTEVTAAAEVAASTMPAAPVTTARERGARCSEDRQGGDEGCHGATKDTGHCFCLFQYRNHEWDGA